MPDSRYFVKLYLLLSVGFLANKQPNKPRIFMQPSSTFFKGIDLSYNFIRKNDAFAFLRWEIRFCIVPISQDSCAVIRESGSALGVKMPKINAVGLFPVRLRPTDNCLYRAQTLFR
jgi:hypothetical protein